MSTEIVCYPDAIEFGGITWRLNKSRKDNDIEYQGVQPGVGRVRVYKYPDEYWGAWNSLDLLITEEFKPIALHQDAGIIVDTVEEAMSFALNARESAQKDLQKMLLALGVGDPYSVGFRDGQQSLKDKLAEVLK